MPWQQLLYRLHVAHMRRVLGESAEDFLRLESQHATDWRRNQQVRRLFARLRGASPVTKTTYAKALAERQFAKDFFAYSLGARQAKKAAGENSDALHRQIEKLTNNLQAVNEELENLKPVRHRAYLFMTRVWEGRPQLLVFDHVDPHLQCGIQTPGGTIDPGESPETAALREAKEETGLTEFDTPHLLAKDDFESETEWLKRYFFHLPVTQTTEASWIHKVGGAGSDEGIEFKLMWVDLPGAGDLAPHFRAYLDRVPLQTI